MDRRTFIATFSGLGLISQSIANTERRVMVTVYNKPEQMYSVVHTKSMTPTINLPYYPRKIYVPLGHQRDYITNCCSLLQTAANCAANTTSGIDKLDRYWVYNSKNYTVYSKVATPGVLFFGPDGSHGCAILDYSNLCIVYK